MFRRRRRRDWKDPSNQRTQMAMKTVQCFQVRCYCNGSSCYAMQCYAVLFCATLYGELLCSVTCDVISVNYVCVMSCLVMNPVTYLVCFVFS